MTFAVLRSADTLTHAMTCVLFDSLGSGPSSAVRLPLASDLREDFLEEAMQLPPWLRVCRASCSHVSAQIAWTKLKTSELSHAEPLT